ncbi:MAG: hypothetical protein ACLFWD_10510 [Anaerolineales bacterium]
MRKLGWIAFSLAWIPFIGIFVGMIGLPEGSYAWSELPLITRYSLIASGAMFALAMVGITGAPLLSWGRNRDVLKDGERGEAVILEMRDTGTTINEQPIVSFKLQVEPISGAPFEAETERLIPRLMVPQIQPGTRVPVRYDPRTKAVALDIE